MHTVAGILRSFQSTLSNYKFPTSVRYEEQFAVRRFEKKFEEPSTANVSRLSSECWDNFIIFDSDLDFNLPLPGEWYIARQQLHDVIRSFSVHDVRFPKGSEFIPTNGANSLQARLECSKWTCTRESFDHFAKLCYAHKGLRRSAKRRYSRWYASKSFDESRRKSNSILYRYYSGRVTDVGFSIFKWKLSQIVTFVNGSRFATVPKNNSVRRPINIEPFGNLVCQAGIGDYIRRDLLLGHFGVDLDSLQSVHRLRISSDAVATIDLKNASDSVSMKLVEFLFPKWFVSTLDDARSSMVFGPDESFHLLKKISSMGNGFTFELMTLILTTICRILDPDSSVYGDDIIISKDKAGRLVTLLTSVGFVVNLEKSFIDGPFRESCGANYLDGYGYIESYDFLWPTSIFDCIVTFNKVRRLSKKYPAFLPLYRNLERSIPKVLRGGPCYDFDNFDVIDLIGRRAWSHTRGFQDTLDDVKIPPYFVTDKGTKLDRNFKHYPSCSEYLRTYLQLDDIFYVTYCFKFVASQRTPAYKHLKSSHWAKFEFYLASGRRALDVYTGLGKWVSFISLNSGYNLFNVKDVMSRVEAIDSE